MKRMALLIIGCMLVGTMSAQDLVANFLKKFEKETEFSIVNISPKMFELISVMADDEEEEGILKKLTGLKVISTEKNAGKYYKEASRMLASSDHEELMSVVDGTDNVQMFVKEKKKGLISSLIITIQEPDEFTMIGITGEIDLKQLSTISKTLNIDKLDKIDNLE
ncbi:DUF4252 domain-containing protein [Bacteroides sp. OttesenSCG-928-D19]|nr:DUF4252 domain-containing protein [Bacteroides sp. OttesenSCG-928-D19]